MLGRSFRSRSIGVASCVLYLLLILLFSISSSDEVLSAVKAPHTTVMCVTSEKCQASSESTSHGIISSQVASPSRLILYKCCVIATCEGLCRFGEARGLPPLGRKIYLLINVVSYAIWSGTHTRPTRTLVLRDREICRRCNTCKPIAMHTWRI